MDVFEVINTTRAMRRLKPDPVPDELIWKVLEAWNATYGAAREAMAADPNAARMFASADHLANHLAEVPVLIIAAIRGGDTGTSPAGSYVYPAVQNLMLAARALGLGTTLTTLHRAHEGDVKELLAIPDNVETMALIPLGWPKGKFGMGPRRPVEEVAYWDKWGETRER